MLRMDPKLRHKGSEQIDMEKYFPNTDIINRILRKKARTK